jgi:predicted porin
MKRSVLIAALSTLAAGSAFAQSSVTIYGRLNTSVERVKVDGVKETVVNNNASRLGFKGTEDLGGGLKANFFLEHRFNSDNGATTSDFWSGDSWVGLSGGFGEVRLGRMTSGAYYATADYVSLHNHDTGTSADILYGLGNQAAVFFAKNKVSYTTPSLGGLTAEVQYALREAGTTPGSDLTTKNGTDVALNYAAGPLALGAGFTKVGDDKQFAVRGLYTAGDFIFGGYYQRTMLETSMTTAATLAGFGANDGKANVVRVSAQYNLGASEFHANVGWAGDVGDVDNSGAKQYTLAYNYNLSKRTKVYTYFTKVSAESNNFYTVDARSVALGIRHNF